MCLFVRVCGLPLSLHQSLSKRLQKSKIQSSCCFRNFRNLNVFYEIVLNFFDKAIFINFPPISASFTQAMWVWRFCQRCDFNRNLPIFSNRHRWRQRQHLMCCRLCKRHLSQTLLHPRFFDNYHLIDYI